MTTQPKLHEVRRAQRQQRIACLQAEVEAGRGAPRTPAPSLRCAHCEQPIGLGEPIEASPRGWVHQRCVLLCATCGKPASLYDGRTASSATYHSNGRRTVVAWHLPACYPVVVA